ncbi:MAG TPA: 50S ribosomal protein L9 [Thermomicrobiaceae bacterium]|nr:50S ribosomal protein L9 [Thermomicrobiaceae bacterium]
MKVILSQDVPNVGEAGAIAEVKDGFARNYLIPKGFAAMATPGTLRVAQERLKAEQRRIEKEEQAQQALADRIDGTRIDLTARMGEQGRLYGSITAQDIADALSAQTGQEIDRRKVLLDDPIRAAGEHTVTVHLVGRLRPTIVVNVVSVDAEGAVVTGEPAATAEDQTGESEVSEPVEDQDPEGI